MLDILCSQIAISGQARLVVDIAMYFGLFLLVAMSLNFQYGNAGIPNMGCAVQVITGGFTVSALTTRLTFWILKMAGVPLLSYASDYDWIYNNQHNISVLTNTYLKDHALLCISLIMFSLGLSVILGMIVGWIISLPAIRLQATYLMIVLITMGDASLILGRNIVGISGGTLGMYVPNVFAFYPGDRSVVMATLTLFIGLVCFFIFRTMLNSPFGRVMRAMRENETTVNSVGKDVVSIRRNVLMFASGVTSIAGCLIAFYFSFVVESNYTRAYWTYWPWLMLILGGRGNNAGTFLGVASVVLMRRLIMVNKWFLQGFFYFPIAYLESVLLGTLLIIFIIFRPKGLIPEKLLYIPGINYRELIKEEFNVDWRSENAQRKNGKEKEDE